ncbi:MAG: endonuclease/exonuclease/phosphatase family protein [Planctomycetes bacterium]|nr:endonuclease/exonuclease/phosphatase family protein [Planctomycetota bacterium]
MSLPLLRAELAAPAAPPVAGLRVMTYNAHRCVGIDRRHAPLRIAQVIAACSADVVAVQELLVRSTGPRPVDQPRAIAERLGYDVQFMPARRRRDGLLGNAIFSRLPLAVRHAAPLPSIPALRRWPRSALWTAVRLGALEIHVFNAHLSLVRAERVAQADALLGADWLAHPDCSALRILCGDFNATPRCPSYRRFAGTLRDAQRAGGLRRPLRTWPSLLPFRLIDHMFLSPEITVRRVLVPRTPLTRLASDHLPLVADLELPAPHRM